jgi:hypothetical protein
LGLHYFPHRGYAFAETAATKATAIRVNRKLTFGNLKLLPVIDKELYYESIRRLSRFFEFKTCWYCERPEQSDPILGKILPLYIAVPDKYGFIQLY